MNNSYNYLFVYLFTQLSTLKISKHGLCPYEGNRYLLVDLVDSKPNPNNHAYGHKDLAAEKELVAGMPDGPGTKLLIERPEERLSKKHSRVLAIVTDRRASRLEWRLYGQ